MNELRKITVKNYPLPTGEQRDFNLNYQIYGRALHEAPIVLVNHALTGNSQVAGKDGWWKKLIGENKVIDLNYYTVIAFNIPGNAFDRDSDYILTNHKIFTTKIIAELFWKGLEALGISELYAVIGGSLGGGIAWEMAFLKPDSIQHLIPIASNLTASDWLIGNVLVQEQILENSKNPIADARMHAMLTYRTPEAFQKKFNYNYNANESQYDVESWLKYHGQQLNERFGLKTYKLMNHLLKTIGQDLKWGDVLNFAKNSRVNVHIIAVDSDWLFTRKEQWDAFKFLRRHKRNISFSEIRSIHGHDAFLIEYEQLSKLLKAIFKTKKENESIEIRGKVACVG